MKVIWKYKLKIPNRGISQEIEMPIRAEIISVNVIDGEIYMYCMIEGSYINEKKIRVINIVDTGEEMVKYAGIYVGTAVLIERALVLHVFDYGYNK